MVYTGHTVTTFKCTSITETVSGHQSNWFQYWIVYPIIWLVCIQNMSNECSDVSIDAFHRKNEYVRSDKIVVIRELKNAWNSYRAKTNKIRRFNVRFNIRIKMLHVFARCHLLVEEQSLLQKRFDFWWIWTECMQSCKRPIHSFDFPMNCTVYSHCRNRLSRSRQVWLQQIQTTSPLTIWLRSENKRIPWIDVRSTNHLLFLIIKSFFLFCHYKVKL